jgi:hypothetical protein
MALVTSWASIPMMCLGVRPDIFEGKNITQKWMTTDEITIDDGSLMAATWRGIHGDTMFIFFQTLVVCLGHFGIKNRPRKIKERKERKEHHQSKSWDSRHEFLGI